MLIMEKLGMRQELENTGKKVLDASRTELYIAMRFMGEALSSLSYEMDLTTTSVGTDAVSIRFNPSYVLQLFVEEPGKLNRTYLHMILHCIFRHMYTSASFSNERLYDLCADIVVESILDGMDYQCIYRISSDYRDRVYEELENAVKVLTVERLYKYFSEKEPDIFELEKLEREFFMDDHGFWTRLQDVPKDDESKEKPDEKDKPPIPDDYENPFDNKNKDDEQKKKEHYISPRRLKQIQSKEKDWDKSAKRMQTEIETIGRQASDRLGKLGWILKYQNTNRRDYKEFLERFMVIREEGGIDMDSFDYGMYCFGMEYYGNMPLIEENEFREVKKVQELAIAIDTSASCKDELVQKFLDETASMLLRSENFFQKIRIHILQCDDQVQRIERIESVDDMKKYSDGIHVEGGFGTDFRPVFEKLQELKENGEIINLKGLLYFTDGYGIYPEKPVEYDTAFVFPKDGDFDDEKVPDWALKLYIQ